MEFWEGWRVWDLGEWMVGWIAKVGEWMVGWMVGLGGWMDLGTKHQGTKPRGNGANCMVLEHPKNQVG